MKSRAQQILESKIRKMVREELDGKTQKSRFDYTAKNFYTVFRKRGNNSFSVGTYVTEKAAKDVARFLTKMEAYSQESARDATVDVSFYVEKSY